MASKRPLVIVTCRNPIQNGWMTNEFISDWYRVHPSGALEVRFKGGVTIFAPNHWADFNLEERD